MRALFSHTADTSILTLPYPALPSPGTPPTTTYVRLRAIPDFPSDNIFDPRHGAESAADRRPPRQTPRLVSRPNTCRIAETHGDSTPDRSSLRTASRRTPVTMPALLL